MKTIFFLCVMAFGGCSSTPLPEYNYRASLPERVAVNISVATDFAADLAAKSGLQIVDQSKVTGNPNVDATFAVHLKPRGEGDVSVTVMVNMPWIAKGDSQRGHALPFTFLREADERGAGLGAD